MRDSEPQSLRAQGCAGALQIHRVAPWLSPMLQGAERAAGLQNNTVLMISSMGGGVDAGPSRMWSLLVPGRSYLQVKKCYPCGCCRMHGAKLVKRGSCQVTLAMRVLGTNLQYVTCAYAAWACLAARCKNDRAGQEHSPATTHLAHDHATAAEARMGETRTAHFTDGLMSVPLVPRKISSASPSAPIPATPPVLRTKVQAAMTCAYGPT